ncbi:ABC transporter permease [Paenibacillus sp. GCM10027627]|uniref:ABC transporter permease n=1 Tax=unclassified Paenibacillus TaxID=185978 RepID=UPI00362F54F0
MGTGLDVLWGDRAKAFRKETMPYFRYMFQSGFPSFLSLIVIASVIGYFKLIHNLPPDFPIVWTGILALTPLICWSPLRTYLSPADVVYLMPREYDMGPYLKRAYWSIVPKNVVLGSIVFLLYMPIYVQGEAMSGPWLLAFAAAALKVGNKGAAWQERRMAWPGIRRLFRTARWVMTGAALASWLTVPVWQAAVFTVLCGLLLWIGYRLPKRHRLPWERLIEEEGTTRKRYYAFFSLFIDVPILSIKVVRRPYLSWVLPRIPFAHRHTFVFLFSASLTRTEIGGILVRLLLLGGLVGYWTADAAGLAGWGAFMVYLLFVVIYGLQLGALRSVHRHSVWKHVYPLPDDEQTEQLLKVDKTAFTAGLLLLWLPSAIPLLIGGIVVPPLAALALAAAYAFIRPARLRKKILKEAEDE